MHTFARAHRKPAAYPGQLSTRQKEWPTPTAAFQQAFGKAKE